MKIKQIKINNEKKLEIIEKGGIRKRNEIILKG
jgi:hypothetical protein